MSPPDYTIEIKDAAGLIIARGTVIDGKLTWIGRLKSVYELILLEKENVLSRESLLKMEVDRLNGLLNGRAA